MENTRDNFTQKTKKILQDRCGAKCSNPHCRRQTLGPGNAKFSTINMGTAAHICAAAKGGPRYDASMTEEERKSPDNGIWLCNFCADLIDKDVNRYTVERLQQWKLEAERNAEHELHGMREIYTANALYTNSFCEALFLHKANPESKVNLRNLFVMLKYEDLNERPIDGQYTVNADLPDKLRQFIQSDKNMLFISGSGGSGKTTLISWLNYHYYINDVIAEDILADRPLITIRLRDLNKDLISKHNSLVPALKEYMKIASLDELEQRYPNAVMVLDGFDELCMIENLTTPMKLIKDLESKRMKGYKYLITSRPKYIRREVDVSADYISILHFDLEQVITWIEHFTSEQYCNEHIDEKIILYLSAMDENTLSTVCDTPMNLYMLVSKKTEKELVHNNWFLYRHIFYNEMSETEYNQMFPDPDRNYAHGIDTLKDVLYQLSEEIAYHMYKKGNAEFCLHEDVLKKIIDDLSKEHPILERANMKNIASQCYALCCYWKESSDRGAIEFLHNDIRDFFLAEKIYRTMNAVYEQTKIKNDRIWTLLLQTICELFPYGVLETKVTEFLLLHSMYNYQEGIEDFASQEMDRKAMPETFHTLCINPRSYLNTFQNTDLYYPVTVIENILTSMIQTYRHVLEPYYDVENIFFEPIPFFSSMPMKHDYCSRFMKAIFNQVPVTLDETSMLTLGSKWDFTNIYLKGQDLRNIGFQHASLSGANLSDTILCGCDFTGADLIGADLSNADIHYACLLGADLEECNLTGAMLWGTELPDGFCSNNQEEQVEHLRQLKIKGLTI